MKRSGALINLASAMLVLAAAAACSSRSKLAADQYYAQASTAFSERNYDVAINHYKDLLDQYPFDPHAEEAELRIAHAQYRTKHYPEAIAAFNDFQRMHPMSPHLPQVYYLLGKSYMDQMKTIDRDQAAAANAHGWFRVVIDRYPASPYAAKAERQLAKCRDALAGHELHIAKYYFSRDNLSAGENRVKGILENYPETPVATRALEQLAAAYAKAGDSEHEQMARAAIAERPPPAEPADDEDEDESDDAAPTVAPSQSASASAAVSASDAPGAQGTTIAGRLSRPRSDPAAGARGPRTEALLAQLSARYGPGQGVSSATTAPSLIDPAAPSKIPMRDEPGYRPVPGSEPGTY